jgi:hypothetical protein
MLAPFAAALLLVGCENNEQTGQPATRQLTVTVGPLVEPPPPPPKPKPKPKPKPATGAAAWSDQVVSPYSSSKRDIYQQSRDVCGVFSAAQVAKEYKAESSSPVDAALAYSKATYQPVFQQPAFEGCLDGFG